jgi:hypothetical protein
MSHIPNSAMPHAGAPSTTETNQGGQQQQQQGVGSTISAQAGKVADYARENPKTAAAAGVAIVGAIAAAAIPLVRGLGSDTTSEKGGSAKKNKQGS